MRCTHNGTKSVRNSCLTLVSTGLEQDNYKRSCNFIWSGHEQPGQGLALKSLGSPKWTTWLQHMWYIQEQNCHFGW